MRTIKLTDTIEITGFPESKEDLKYYLPDIKAIDQRVTKKYHSKAIQKKARVSAIQISHWTKTGVIIPAIAVKGTGKMHVYDHQNLIEAMICRELSQYSINYGVMREVLDFLREKKWLFDIHLESIKLSRILKGTNKLNPKERQQLMNEKGITSEKRLTIWEFFKLYPQTGIIYLLLWKNSTLIELPEPKTGEYNMHLTTMGVYDIVHRCPSSIVLNPTFLLFEAGSFYEEAEC